MMKKSRRVILTFGVFLIAPLIGFGLLNTQRMVSAEPLELNASSRLSGTTAPTETAVSSESHPTSVVPIPTDHQVGEQDSPAVESTPAQASAFQTQAHAPTLLEQFAEQFIAWDQALKAPKSADQAFKERISQVPIARNRKVERHIRYFTTDNRERFTQWLTRLNHYKPLVEQIFAEFDLPSDLVYLSLIESGFNPRAYSRARATGPWQFMKGTGKQYGLRVNWYVDERRDPIKSTAAAARFLRDMYDSFGTWPLALAAYNAGERKVRRALRKARAESYWEIAQTRYLRRETREYVPKFMAAAIIAKNPEQFGFKLEQSDPHQFDEVAVRRSVHLQAVARATGIPYPELRRLNPELRRKVTPPYDSEYYLKVPAGTKENVEKAFSGIKTWKIKKSGKNGNGWYKVRIGDSLWKIARRFRTTVAELKALNNLMSHRIKPGDLLAISP